MRFIRSFFIPWVSSLVLAACASAQGEPRVHIAHCYVNCPQSDNDSSRQIVVHHLYAADIEPESGLAKWVAYRVLGDSLGVASLLPRFWQVDPLLDEEPGVNLEGEDVEIFQPDLSNAQDREYRVNEVQINAADRGRLAPMTSFAGTPYWGDLNNLSNMAPLPTDLRVGSWARLEQAINALATQAGDVYVISGSLVAPEEMIEEPGAYFKVVLAANRLSAFVFPSDLRQNDSYCDQLGSLQAIEARTNLNLLPALKSGELTLAGSLNIELGCGASE